MPTTNKERQQAWAKRHPEANKLKSRAWRKAHPEDSRAQVKAYRARNLAASNFRIWKYDLMKKFGLTPEDWHLILVKQDGRCANQACLEPLLHPCVDHKHVDGFEDLPPQEKKKHVRGLLCSPCNAGLGMFKDSQKLLIGAAHYLQGDDNGTLS